MKFDLRLISALNDSLHFPDILGEERGDYIPPTDFNTECIYHADSDPSMRVYQGKGKHAYCFTCGKAYTPYHALKYLTGLNFFEIFEYAVDNYGFKIPEDLSAFDEVKLPNKEMAEIIRDLRGVANPKIMAFTNMAIAIDSKQGTSDALQHIHSKLFQDCI